MVLFFKITKIERSERWLYHMLLERRVVQTYMHDYKLNAKDVIGKCSVVGLR